MQTNQRNSWTNADSVQVTFPQRYYVVEDFWKRPDGPVFLYIGGEEELDYDEFKTGNKCRVCTLDMQATNDWP